MLASTLADLGVGVVFYCAGSDSTVLLAALERDGRIRCVELLHPSAAVHAAQGYARTTGRVGTVLVSSGSGVGGAVPGLLDALADSTPILCISGQLSQEHLTTDAHQECDALGLTRPVTKWNVQVREIDRVRPLVRKAFFVALMGCPGPVLVDVPVNIQESSCAGVNYLPFVSIPSRRGRRIAAKHMARAAAEIQVAKRPVFYGGGGLSTSGVKACELFSQLVRRTAAPCVLSMMGLGAFPSAERQCLGMLGENGTLAANLAMHQADLIVCVGARFDALSTCRREGFAPNARVLHFDVDPAAINKVVRANLAYVGDAASLLTDLLEHLESRDLDPARLDSWWTHIEEWRSDDGRDELSQASDGLTPQRVMASLSGLLQQRGAVVCCDAGPHQLWAARYLRLAMPRQWLTSGAFGTKGFGLPAALGACLGTEGSPVVYVTSPSNVLVHIQELATASRYRLPIKIVLCGSEIQDHEDDRGGRPSPMLDSLPDHRALAHAFGCPSWEVRELSRLNVAVDAWLAAPGPAVLDVRLAPSTCGLTRVTRGGSHDQVCLRDGAPYQPASPLVLGEPTPVRDRPPSWIAPA